MITGVKSGALIIPAIINASDSGANQIIAAVTSKKLLIVSCVLMASDAVTVRFRSGTSGNYLTGPMPLIASVGFSLSPSTDGWFITSSGELLNLELSDAVSVGGCLTYIEV